MTPEESRKLEIGDRVYWRDKAKDQGAIVGRDQGGRACTRIPQADFER